MKKPTQKKPFKQQPKFPRIVYHILGILIILVSLWIADIITGALEKQKFMSLKQDMLALQAEFNKIDPGWEYDEACNAQGEKFKSHLASSCGVYLKNKDIALTVEQYLTAILKSKSFIKTVDQTYKSDEVYRRQIIFDYKKYTINCSLGVELSGKKLIKSGLGCRGEAREFYFKKLL